MKKSLLILFAVLTFSLAAFSQATPVKVIRIADNATELGENLSTGNLIYNIATSELWAVTAPIPGTETLTSASGSLLIVNGNGSTDLSEGTATTTTVNVNSSTGGAAVLQSATSTRAGLLPALRYDDIILNNAKVTNANHTGDVTGSLSLTIGNDKVDDNHINWGSNASQVSTDDVPEGSTNWWYTDARVSANPAVAANTAKTGITVQQASDIEANNAKTGITAGQASAITANTAKISYTDAAVVSSNATHRTTTTGNPHSVTKSDVGLGNVPNTDFTSAVAANTAKTGITAQQASDITANNAKTGITAGQASAITANTAKISYTDGAAVSSNTAHRTTTTGNPHSVTKSNVGLGNVPNTDFTSAVAANTAKVTNQPTSLSVGTKTSTTVGITSDGGSNDVVLPAATGTAAGLLTSALYNKIQGIASGADDNFIFITESFEENDGTPTAHSLSHTAQTGGAVVSLNGSTLTPSDYTLTASTITIGLPVSQYDKVTISYNY